MKEEWKNIPWFKWFYQVSWFGRIKSLKNWIRWFWKEKILKHYKNKKWYCYVKLWKNWIFKNYAIHRLVLFAFIWENTLQCNHKDWNPSNNVLENLEYCTASENIKHSYRVLKRKPNLTSLWKFWKNSFSGKKVNQYTKEWEFIKTWDCIINIEKKLSINASNISKVCKWKNKTAWWFIWKYA